MDKTYLTATPPHGKPSSGTPYINPHLNESVSTVNTSHDSTVDAQSTFSRSPTSSTNQSSNTVSTKSSTKHTSQSTLAKLFIPHRPAVNISDTATPRARYGRGLQRPSTHQYPSRGRRNSFRETISDLIEKPSPKAESPGNSPTSSTSIDSSVQKASRSLSIDRSHLNNYTQVGRHSNDWLFGGWGKIFKKD